MELKNRVTRKKGKHIEVFSDGCPDCIDHINNVEVGKCAGCKLEILSINDNSDLITKKKILYKITTHPTTIIDQEIKVEGIPSFYWLCGDDFYNKLKKDYPLISD